MCTSMCINVELLLKSDKYRIITIVKEIPLLIYTVASFVQQILCFLNPYDAFRTYFTVYQSSQLPLAIRPSRKKTK